MTKLPLLTTLLVSHYFTLCVCILSTTYSTLAIYWNWYYRKLMIQNFNLCRVCVCKGSGVDLRPALVCLRSGLVRSQWWTLLAAIILRVLTHCTIECSDLLPLLSLWGSHFTRFLLFISSCLNSCTWDTPVEPHLIYRPHYTACRWPKNFKGIITNISQRGVQRK